MAKYEFDVSKIKKVSIEKVVPNGWNPKEKDTAEYQKVRDSIQKKGLLGYVLVREHPHTPGYFEIIDGEQRYTAAKELNYKNINVYNAGTVDEKNAKELTIWFQQQVPFNRVTEAYLVTELVSEYGADLVEIPYDEAQIADMSNLADFNFDMYDKGTEGDDGNNTDGVQLLAFKLQQTDYDLVTSALASYKQANSCVDATHALIMICTELRIDQGGDE